MGACAAKLPSEHRPNVERVSDRIESDYEKDTHEEEQESDELEQSAAPSNSPEEEEKNSKSSKVDGRLVDVKTSGDDHGKTTAPPDHQQHRQYLLTMGYLRMEVPMEKMHIPQDIKCVILSYFQKTFIVDVFHRQTDNDMNKPIRHVFHVYATDEMHELAKQIGEMYGISPKFILFFENWNCSVSRQWRQDIVADYIPNKEPFACYILKDWNQEITKSEIKSKKLALNLAKISHGAPLDDANKILLFGVPFCISYLNVTTRKQLYKLVYQRMCMWIGTNVLTQDAEHEREHNEYDSEERWDYVLNNLPFKLWNYIDTLNMRRIPIDNQVYGAKQFAGYHLIVIEWKESAYKSVKNIVNKVIVDSNYKQWKRNNKEKLQQYGLYI
mmetsp:Transcript_7627/g.12482  ORF Transcript_7627/g.12482 Transcript_7627/m.12482 type:complete len:384 (-) Transcript_7627:706-1857(-)|eukprot:CAMPEP_0197081096 /NCGR_PEP_ID=MMETSP1384-20130603/214462_1 /TAXON_ID=29189 /ORGANISM="Ammonia sp." /LENGTH=383 /DNA_ID=CAMNT_0042519989 /DNA_START=16 /DNA_END=1167 /DNA_ORIENTATION=-